MAWQYGYLWVHGYSWTGTGCGRAAQWGLRVCSAYDLLLDIYQKCKDLQESWTVPVATSMFQLIVERGGKVEQEQVVKGAIVAEHHTGSAQQLPGSYIRR
jgi:hypothetical protein